MLNVEGGGQEHISGTSPVRSRCQPSHFSAAVNGKIARQPPRLVLGEQVRR